jgi:hypothetical protein
VKGVETGYPLLIVSERLEIVESEFNPGQFLFMITPRVDQISPQLGCIQVGTGKSLKSTFLMDF